MNAITFEINLLEPVLVMSGGGGDPNSATSLDFIPGSTIRGALITAWIKAGNTPDSADKKFRTLFLDGTVRFLNAYPVSAFRRRMLPVPLSWKYEKDAAKPGLPLVIQNFSIEGGDHVKNWSGVNQFRYCLYSESGGSDSQNYADVEAGNESEYIPPSISEPVAHLETGRSALQVDIHIARSDRQRVTDEGSTIYRYQTLSRGQSFAAVILSDDEQYLTQLLALMPESSRARLGKSQQAGYGAVSLEKVKKSPWTSEYSGSNTDAGELLQVTLLSGALLRDAKTGATTLDLPAWLGVAAGDVIGVCADTCVISGFNRAWNLPAVQVTMLAAGSVFVFRASDEIRQKVRAYETTGLGERLGEGYGRIAINWQTIKVFQVDLDAGKEVRPVSIDKKETQSLALARRMANRILRSRLEVALLKVLPHLTIGTNGLQNSQLSGLRVNLRHAWSKNDLSVVIEYLKNMKSAGRGQLMKARVDGRPLFEWVESLAAQPTEIWRTLDVSNDPRELPTIGGVSAELAGMEKEFAIRLMDGMLQQSLKAKGGRK